MKKLTTGLLLTAAIILSSFCYVATAAPLDDKAKALVAATPGKDFAILVVPSASNFISNKMVLASLKSGVETQPAQEISAMLQKPVPVKLAITGDNDAIAHATLERALIMLKGKTVTAKELVFIGDKEYAPALVAMAAELGITLIYVPFS